MVDFRTVRAGKAKKRARDKVDQDLRSREKRLDIVTMRDWGQFGATLLAAVAAVVGVWTWIAERDDRMQERNVRRATLASSAREILINEEGTIEPTYSVQQAIWNLHLLDQPVEIRAKNVNLTGLVLPCGAYSISAENLFLDATSVYQAFLFIRADNVELYSSLFRNTEVIVRHPNVEVANLKVRSSRALNSHFTFDDDFEVMTSTFSNSKVRSWFGELSFSDVRIFDLTEWPSRLSGAEPGMGSTEFFESESVDAARSEVDLEFEIWEKFSDPGDILAQQRATFGVVANKSIVLSKEWSEYCVETIGGFSCERTSPKIFANEFNPTTGTCSSRNSYFDFDPEIHGDQPPLQRDRYGPF